MGCKVKKVQLNLGFRGGPNLQHELGLAGEALEALEIQLVKTFCWPQVKHKVLKMVDDDQDHFPEIPWNRTWGLRMNLISALTTFSASS